MPAEPLTPYFLSGPWAEVSYLEVPDFPTVVQKVRDHPLARIRSLFDDTFGALFPALGANGLRPMGAPFSLYHRMPTDTVDIEVGIPVDHPLTHPVTSDGVTLTPSVLPAGRIAIVSYYGAYDGLGEAWGRFMGEIAAAGHQPDFPFWEVYLTEPVPGVDPASLRTDLVTRLATD